MFLYNIESIAKKLQIDYEDVTSHIQHMGVRGTSREDVLRQRIKELLPQKFTVGSGIITDHQGKQSHQQDFFVYDAFNSPTFLQTESSCIIPVESVYATIEVKSTLNKETLRQSVENIKSVKELELSVLQNSPFIPQKYNYIFGAIFAYSSETTIETIAKNLGEFCKKIPYSQQPNIVCILNQGIIIHTPKVEGRQIEIIPSEKTTIAIIKNNLELNLYLFYLVLQQHLNTAKNFQPNLLKYAEQSGALNNLQIYIPFELIPEDMTIKAGNTNLSGEEVKFLGEYNEIIFKLLTKQLTEDDLKKFSLSEEQVIKIKEQVMAIIGRSLGGDSKTKIIEQTDKK